MLYLLLLSSERRFRCLNVFRYITFRTGGAMMTALLFIFMFGPGIITLLKLQAGQGPADPHRRAGAPSHRKAGTPTMGGLMILSGIVISTLLWADLANRLRLGGAVRHARLRRDRLLRRLSQGDQAHPQRLLRRMRLLFER